MFGRQAAACFTSAGAAIMATGIGDEGLRMQRTGDNPTLLILSKAYSDCLFFQKKLLGLKRLKRQSLLNLYELL